MFHSKLAIALLGVASLTFGPASVSFGDLGASAAYAKGGNGGGGGGNGGGGGASSSKSDKASERGKSSGGKSTSGSKGKSGTKKKDGAAGKSAAKTKSAKPKQAEAVEASARPKARDMGKMNGALNANINAVLAHIRNGNLNGPVGLLAGLAIADANAASAEAKAAELQDLADAHDALTTELEALDITLEEYLAGEDENGPLELTEEEIDKIDGLIEDVGGVKDGELATTRPTDDEIETAKTEAQGTEQAVTDAEAAIIDAWNKDGDEEALLTALRDRLEGHEAEIADAIASTEETEETAEAPASTETEEPVAAN